jgi:hypothetical protein
MAELKCYANFFLSEVSLCPYGQCHDYQSNDSDFFLSLSQFHFDNVNLSGPIAGNVSICVRAGLSKPRLVPDTERT